MKRGFDSTQFKRKEPATKIKKIQRPLYVKPINYTKLEKKFFDTIEPGTITLPIVGGPVGIPGASINLVSQGNTENTMIGRKMTIKSIETRFMLQLQKNQIITSNIFKLALVLDKQANGVSATSNLVYEQPSAFGFRNLDQQKRFQVLKEWNGDITADTNNPTLGNTQDTKQYFHWFKKCNIEIEFSPQVGMNRDITEVKSNNLLLLGYSDTGLIQFTGNFRIKYTDA